MKARRGIRRHRRGRDSRASTIVSGRQYAVRVEGTVIFFECDRAGHSYKIDWSKKSLTKRMGPEGCKMMAGWWSREKGGCIGNCPMCDKEAKQKEQTREAPRRSCRRSNEPLLDTSAGVGRDEHDSLLSEDSGDLASQLLSPLEDLNATVAGGAHDHLHHVPVLAATSPDAPRLEEGRVLELPLDRGFDQVSEDALVEGQGRSLVASRVAGDARSDVEPNRASRTEGHTSNVAGAATTNPQKETLARRSGRETSRFYLYFEVDRRTGQLGLETSWLPDMPEVRASLEPLGFRRRDDGTYCVAVSDVVDVLGIQRRVARALACLLEEATL